MQTQVETPMLIRCGYDIAFDCPVPTPIMLILSVHPSRLGDLLEPQGMRADPDIGFREYRDGFGNICHRVLAPAGETHFRAGFTIRDSGLPDAAEPDARQFLVQDLPDEALVFLLGSRYCETDKLSDTAWSLFGSTQTGWARVQAIVDYVHERITFGYEHARPDKTAWDAFQERRGVCRDFAHLAVTLCRCMNIPARYCTGYLGDIGVPPAAAPMDFSAWFDVYLDGRRMVHLRRTPQPAPDRPRPAGTRARCDRRRDQHRLRQHPPRAVHRRDGRGAGGGGQPSLKPSGHTGAAGPVRWAAPVSPGRRQGGSRTAIAGRSTPWRRPSSRAGRGPGPPRG